MWEMHWEPLLWLWAIFFVIGAIYAICKFIEIERDR